MGADGSPSAPLPRFLRVAISASIGAFVGLAIGIGGSLLFFPLSNIAPAYGILLVAPAGFIVGALYGWLRAE